MSPSWERFGAARETGGARSPVGPHGTRPAGLAAGGARGRMVARRRMPARGPEVSARRQGERAQRPHRPDSLTVRRIEALLRRAIARAMRPRGAGVPTTLSQTRPRVRESRTRRVDGDRRPHERVSPQTARVLVEPSGRPRHRHRRHARRHVTRRMRATGPVHRDAASRHDPVRRQAAPDRPRCPVCLAPRRGKLV
jgi:hypothetical protein